MEGKMRNLTFLVSVTFITFGLCNSSFAANEEEITLTTYYPAPYGSYTKLDVYDPDTTGYGGMTIHRGRYARLDIISDNYWSGVEIRRDSAGVAGRPHIDLTNDLTTNYGIRISAPDNNKLAIEGGNLGIGTTGPTEALEVTGNIKLSGDSPTYYIKNVKAPAGADDVATKGYVDAAAGGGPATWTCQAVSASIPDSKSVGVSVGCPAGTRLITGGCYTGGTWRGGGPTHNSGRGGWYCRNTGNVQSLTARAWCCS